VKVVLDTNVWISSLLLPQSIPGRIIRAWQHALFNVVMSNPILDEIARVLTYPKIRKRLLLQEEDINEYLSFIRFFTDIVDLKPNTTQFDELKDINDGVILATLVASKADYLVTGDQDLLILDKQYPVISPSKFAEFLD
jgi:putative PIN family toxin of toxin-antitoxin system